MVRFVVLSAMDTLQGFGVYVRGVATVVENKAGGRGKIHRHLTNALRASTLCQHGSKRFEFYTSSPIELL